jgi:predicted phage terminase large subunit-like protein
MSAQSAKLESGQCLLPANAVWLEDFKAELLAFPAGRHDDQVDVLSQFLGWPTVVRALRAGRSQSS